MDTKIICRKCKIPQAGIEFYINRTGGREYRKKICRTCDNGTRKFNKGQTWAERCISDPTHKEKRQLYTRQHRRNPKFWPSNICRDSRSSDKKHGRDNDLDKEFVREAIRNGCLYCGETQLRMTMDRMDNSIGHLKTNVQPACIRCNYLRGNMPYEAWLIVALGVRQARKAGAFADWVGGTTRRYVGELEVDYSLPDEGEPED